MSITFKKYLQENTQTFLTDEKEIEAWLDSVKIENYKISNGVVDVTGPVWLHSHKLSSIPVQFGRVEGAFSIGDNLLTSLRGCPHYVSETFQAQANPHLTSYEFLPANSQCIYIGDDMVTAFDDFDWSKIKTSGLVFSAGDIKSGGIGLILIDGLKWFNHLNKVTAGVPEPFKIIQKYLGRPEDIFECQAELIEAGFEEYARL